MMDTPRRVLSSWTVFSTALCLLSLSTALAGGPALTRIVQLHSGKVQGVVVTPKMLRPVDVFLGVPYATPPTGANRFSPTRSVPPWAGVRLCDRAAPSCPQSTPNLTDALGRMPRGKLAALQRLTPLLHHHREDCLYLNVYAPSRDIEDLAELFPVLVFVHGSDDFSSGSGSLYDGHVLAAYSGILVVTLNYRLGALGFLNLNSNPESRPRIANSGLMDQLAALQWVQQNIRQFGGDPGQVTLAGHGTGAACVHFLAVSPAVMPGLFHRIILMSGSALSSWAIVEDPVSSGSSLATEVNCSGHVDVASCLQEVTVEDILTTDVRPAAFLNSFGPSVDGVVIRPDYDLESSHSLREVDVLFGVVTSESLDRFSASDIQAGFDGSRRDRIVRTYVRNAYEYHLPEIFVTIVNEYTDWERTVVHPINTRDATVAALSDAQFVAPVVRTGDYFSASKARSKSKTFFYVFDHQTKHGDYPPKLGTVHGEELPYLFGAPLVESLSHFPRNFTRSETALSEAFMTSVANFVKTGNPNMVESPDQFLPISREKNRFRPIVWEQYDSVHQKYMDISLRPKMKNHFRSHHLSIWLQLIPELHRAGMEDVHTRHNRFHNHHNVELYTGLVRPDPRRENATVAEVILPITTMETMVTTCVNLYTSGTRGHKNSSAEAAADASAAAAIASAAAAGYSWVLHLTIAIGCSLLLLNLLIFAAVYYQRERTRLEMKTLEQHKRNQHRRAETGSHMLKHSASVVLDLDSEAPMMVLNHVRNKTIKNGSAKTFVGQFIKQSKSSEFNSCTIPPPPSPPRVKKSIPTAAMNEITV